MLTYDRTYDKEGNQDSCSLLPKTTTAKKTTTTAPKKKPASLELPRNPLMFEILDLASRQRSKAKKVEVLQKYECMTHKSLLIWNFDETVLSQLPEGEVPFGNPEDQLKYHWLTI